MKSLSLIFALYSLILVAGGCSSGKRAFEKGNYYQSVIKSVERLRRNPDHRKSKETLDEAYPAALEYLTQEITNLRLSNERFNWGRIVTAYERINHMATEIRRSPGALKIISNPRRFNAELTNARKMAAGQYYAEGNNLINPNDREASKDAFYMFRKSIDYVSNYKDALQKMNEAREYATLKVVLEQIPVPGRYSLSASFFQDKVEQFLRRGGVVRNDFVRFYTPREAEKVRLQADQILSIYFQDFVVGQVFKKESTRELRRDSVKVGTVTIDGKSYPSYGTVKAQYTLHRAEVVSEGLLTVRVTDGNNNAVLMRDQIPGTYIWFDEWATFNGDERALTDAQYRLTRQRFSAPPSNQQMFIEFTRPIYDQLTGRLNSFYRRF